jgi:hypothetical protein
MCIIPFYVEPIYAFWHPIFINNTNDPQKKTIQIGKIEAKKTFNPYMQ